VLAPVHAPGEARLEVLPRILGISVVGWLSAWSTAASGAGSGSGAHAVAVTAHTHARRVAVFMGRKDR
jgi:hypothetical protein